MANMWAGIYLSNLFYCEGSRLARDPYDDHTVGLLGMGAFSCANQRTKTVFREGDPDLCVLDKIGLTNSNLSGDIHWSSNNLAQMASIAQAVYHFKMVPGWELDSWYEFGDKGSDEKLETCSWHQNVAVYRRDRECVVAFAGTDEHGSFGPAVGILMKQGDWVTNAETGVRDICGFPGVHAGYADRLQRLFTVNDGKVFQNLNNDIQYKCDGHAAIVGHSLGGGLASLLAACVNSRGEDNVELKPFLDDIFTASALYTFGAPAVTRKWLKGEELLLMDPALGCQMSGRQAGLGTHEKEEISKRQFVHNEGYLEELFGKEEFEKWMKQGGKWCDAVPLHNKLSEDGCFEGFRVYNEDHDGKRVDPVPVKSTTEGYKHAMVSALKLECTSPECHIAMNNAQLKTRGGYRGLVVKAVEILCAHVSARIVPMSDAAGFIYDGHSMAEMATLLDLHEMSRYILRLMAIHNNS